MTDGKQFAFQRCDPNDPDLQFIKAYYGLGDTFPTEQLICSSSEMKKVYYISKEVSDYLYTDASKHQLSILHLGVLLFSRNNGRYGGNMECIFRIV